MSYHLTLYSQISDSYAMRGLASMKRAQTKLADHHYLFNRQYGRFTGVLSAKLLELQGGLTNHLSRFQNFLPYAIKYWSMLINI